MLFLFFAVWEFSTYIITFSMTVIIIIIIIIIIMVVIIITIYCSPYVRGGTTSMTSSFLRSTMAPDSVLLFCRLLIFEFLLGASEILFYLISASQTLMFSLLDALQLLILFSVTLTHSESKLFLLFVFYNDSCFLIK
jgi:hypothetical protein